MILCIVGRREKCIQEEKHQYSSHVQDKQHQKHDLYYMPDLVSVNFENFKELDFFSSFLNPQGIS